MRGAGGERWAVRAQVRYSSCPECGHLYADDGATWYCEACGALLDRKMLPRRKRRKSKGGDRS